MAHKKVAIYIFCFLSFLVAACSGNIKTEAEPEICKDEVSRIFYFAYGSSSLDVATKDSVKNLAQKLACNKGKVRLEGHTDTTSSSNFNKTLGLRRAGAVKDFLISLGIEPSRIETITYGKENPLVKGRGEAVDAQNRCVVVVFEGISE